MKSIVNVLCHSVLNPDHQIQVVTIRNASGMEAQISNYGAIVMSLTVPDRKGEFGNVILGFKNISAYQQSAYLSDNAYLGAIVGRNANVIENARFSVGDKNYLLSKNFGEHNLHGGIKGFDQHIWQVIENSGDRLQLYRLSPDGEEGFPGNAEISVCYEISAENEFIISFHATSDRATPMNMTSHMYFNLAGTMSVLDHELMISSDCFVEFNRELVPTGRILNIKKGPLDFSVSKKISRDIEMPNDQLDFGKGYDLTYVLQSKKPAANLYDPKSGRFMEVYTSLPGMHLYTSNTLNGAVWNDYGPRRAVCLEPQYFPDALNHPEFPSTILNPGEQYEHQIIYRFSTRR